MNAKLKPTAPNQVPHNFGQVTLERTSAAAEAREAEPKPATLLQPVNAAKGFKNAQRYKSPQLLSSTLAIPVMHKNLSKEGQPKSTHLKSARQSMMDFNRIKLQQQEAPDEEMGASLLPAQSPRITQPQQ